MRQKGLSSFAGLVEGDPMHHTDMGFGNLPPAPNPPSPGFAFYMRRFRGSLFLPEPPSDHYLTEETAVEKLNVLKGENTLTWLGHSTFLIRVDGKIILTDPFLTEYASPFIRGPRRYGPPGITIENLPPIDIIIVSHDHYDHLDDETVKKLFCKEKIHVLVPLKLKSFFTQRGYTNVHELDWEEGVLIGGIKITAHPAVHFSGRGFQDRNKTLWCSWTILASSGRYFFAGDTAYSYEIFNDIGEKYKSFNLAMFPIGAYEPKEVMRFAHTNPEEAITAGLDIKANIIVAMHWGTIELSDEPHFEPPMRFKKYAMKTGLKNERAWIMKIGQTRILP